MKVTEREERLREERQVLIALFKATGGAEWKRNDNWCSAKDIGEWFGVEQDSSSGDLTSLKLAGNNLVGELPQGPLGITTLRRMRVCHVQLNALEGEFPQDWSLLECLQVVKVIVSLQNFEEYDYCQNEYWTSLFRYIRILVF